LAVQLVKGLRRVPLPPARIKAFIIANTTLEFICRPYRNAQLRKNKGLK
jgi:hypothetical protein